MKKMSDKKLSSDEVPQKFIEWLLAMGCPAEKILSMEKMNEMCRGQYYMIWRCLMEHVEAKEVIKHKRLTVFCDNVKQCQEKKLLDEKSSSSMLPEQLSLWMKHKRVKEKVVEAEARVNEARAGLNGLMDKVSSKVIQRNTLRQHIANLQRRCWLLGQVSDELATKIANLEETKTIADFLCIVEKEQHDIPSKLDKCIALLQQKRKTNTSSLATPVASSSILSSYENETSISVKDEYVLPLVNCRDDVLWPYLYEKLTSLCSKLSEASTTHVGVGNNRTNTQSMLAHTAAFQSTLALEAIKNKINIQRKQQEIIESSEVLTIHLPENELESLVLKAQRAYSSARLRSLKSLLQQLGAGSGVFRGAPGGGAGVFRGAPGGGAGVFRGAPGGGAGVNNAQAARDSVARVDRCIIKSMGEIQRLMSLSAIGERKIYNIRECLLRIFTAFHNDNDIGDDSLARGVQINFPTESISLLRQFYKKRGEDANVSNLSFDLELSDIPDNSTFVDELNVYLKEFNLEKNRKIVLDNGENVWVFGTVQALRSRLLARWVQHGVTALLHPSLRVSRALRRLCDSTRLLLPAHRACDAITTPAADITAIASYEAETVDKLKKSIAENLNILHKTRKNLDPCEEILHFWSGDRHVAYISTNRSVDGKTYKEYEALYKEKLVASNRCY